MMAIEYQITHMIPNVEQVILRHSHGDINDDEDFLVVGFAVVLRSVDGQEDGQDVVPLVIYSGHVGHVYELIDGILSKGCTYGLCLTLKKGRVK
jgi:hypothetical protein